MKIGNDFIFLSGANLPVINSYRETEAEALIILWNQSQFMEPESVRLPKLSLKIKLKQVPLNGVSVGFVQFGVVLKRWRCPVDPVRTVDCAAGTGNDSSGFRRLGFEKLRYILDHHIGEIVRITAVSGAARGIRPVGEILLRSQRLVDVHSSLDSHITSEKRRKSPPHGVFSFRGMTSNFLVPGFVRNI